MQIGVTSLPDTSSSIVLVKGKAKVINNEREYKIYTLKHLKPQVPDGTVIRDRVYTATSSAACGVQLESGIYLIAGTYRDGGYGKKKQYIGLCSISRKLTRAEAKLYTAPKCP